MMPWRECSVMDERMRFVARRLAGEPMADLCREFGSAKNRVGLERLGGGYQVCGLPVSRLLVRLAPRKLRAWQPGG